MKHFILLFCLFILSGFCFSSYGQKILNNKLFTHSAKNSDRILTSKDTKPVKKYIWHSKAGGRAMEIYFTCLKQKIKIRIKDPEQADYVKGYPAYIKMSVEYSPVLGAENDLRLIHKGGIFLKDKKILKIRSQDRQSFLDNLKNLHQQDIKNKTMIKTEYELALKNCESLKGKQKELCYKTLTTGAYMVSDKPTVIINVISQVLAPKNSSPPGLPAKFNSEQLFKNLKKMPCYK